MITTDARRGPAAALAGTAVLAASAGAAAALAWGVRGEPRYFVPGVLAPVMFVATGLLLRRDPRRRANAAPCFWAAGFTAVGGATALPWSWAQTAGWALEPASAAALTVLLLRYPGDRLPGRADRVLAWAAAAWSAAWALTWVAGTVAAAGGGPWLPGSLAQAPWWTLTVTFVLLTAAVAARVARRVAAARGVERAELIPVAVATVVLAVVATWQNVAFVNPAGDDWGEGSPVPLNLAMLAVPGAFLVAAVQHLAVRARLADLAARVADASAADVRAALARALADPGLEVRYWSPEEQHYVDEAGHPAELPGAGRLLVPVPDRAGTPLAVIVTDRGLAGHPDLVDAAVGASRLALENARLHATVLAQLAAVRGSRQRIVEAGLAERRRVERDLHDGAQQRLLALSMTLGRVRARADEPTRAVVDEARAELRTALAELRDLARGIHPAVLTQAGLRAAVESLTDTAPAGITVAVPDRRWPPAVEATAYFVVAEGLANAARHAPGAAVTVTARDDGPDLLVTVADDGPGPGAADPAGSGLAGLRDRVGALGGTITLDRAATGGAELTARIPCG